MSALEGTKAISRLVSPLGMVVLRVHCETGPELKIETPTRKEPKAAQVPSGGKG